MSQASRAYACRSASGRTVVVCIANGPRGQQALRDVSRGGGRIEAIAFEQALALAGTQRCAPEHQSGRRIRAEITSGAGTAECK